MKTWVLVMRECHRSGTTLGTRWGFAFRLCGRLVAVETTVYGFMCSKF